MQVPPSEEEADLLARSSKKIKDPPQQKENDAFCFAWPKVGDKIAFFSKGGTSFADKLKGVDSNEEDVEEDGEAAVEHLLSDDSLSEDEVEGDWDEPLCKTTEDPSRNFPTFMFSGKMRKRLYKAWNKAVIIKLLDINIGYKALHSRLQAWWAKKGVINLINIGSGFFMVKITNHNDYFNALTGGPWMIYDHYLTVRPWVPNFRPIKVSIDKVAVWVRIPNVPMEYYDREALTCIGNRIGETIKVDLNTTDHLRGHYVRVCVLVDLGKHLLLGFMLDGEEFYLEYEGFHML